MISCSVTKSACVSRCTFKMEILTILHTTPTRINRLHPCVKAKKNKPCFIKKLVNCSYTVFHIKRNPKVDVNHIIT